MGSGRVLRRVQKRNAEPVINVMPDEQFEELAFTLARTAENVNVILALFFREVREVAAS